MSTKLPRITILLVMFSGVVLRSTVVGLYGDCINNGGFKKVFF